MTRVSELARTKLDDHAAGLGAHIGGSLAARVLRRVRNRRQTFRRCAALQPCLAMPDRREGGPQP